MGERYQGGKEDLFIKQRGGALTERPRVKAFRIAPSKKKERQEAKKRGSTTRCARTYPRKSDLPGV